MSDSSIAVPDTAQFFRASRHHGGLKPVTVVEAQPGDIVLLANRRAGQYLGEGRMLLEGGEWAEFVRQLPSPAVGIEDASVYSIDPLEL